jgi:hypothetical protein
MAPIKKSKSVIFDDFEYFERIGEFDAASGLVYGETKVKPLDIMLPGVYIAYNVDQMLLIAHESVDEITPDIMETLKFKDSGVKIFVGHGLQCVYDSDSIKDISKLNGKVLKVKSSMPRIRGNKNDYVDGFIVNSTNIDSKPLKIDFTQVIDEFLPFGVVLSNAVGAGTFPLYTIGRKIAIIGD